MSKEVRSQTPRMTTSSENSSSSEYSDVEVGARHSINAPHRRGGGYLNSCTPEGFDLKGLEKKSAERDPRLDELKKIGYSPRWLAVAETIGYGAFVDMLRVLNDEIDPVDRRVNVPCITVLDKFQRNRYIKSLSQDHSVREIREIVKKELGEDVAIRTISRAISGK